MPTPTVTVPAALSFIPTWMFGVFTIAATLAVTLAFHEVVVRTLRKGLAHRGDFARSLVVRTRSPSRFALLVAALSWSLKVAPVPPGLERTLQHVLLIAIIVLIGWAVLTAVDIGTALYMRRFKLDATNNLHARKLITQTRLLRRALNAVVILVTLALALMTIPGVKQVGVSLLAAGGAAGIIVGLALQPVLSNLMAGVQIAFTQPIRIDDAVVVQKEFGHVEEIGSTYVVIRLPDERRMIVPLKFFLEQPFENWTRESSDLTADFSMLVDQRVPVDRLRAHIEAAAKESPLWDGRLAKVLVNDIRERSLEVRCRLSAASSADAGELRSLIREKTLAWLQAEFPASLPRNGVEFSADESQRAELGSRTAPSDQRVQ
ncbi:MAG: mechanosensitive ion channel family protein [Caulobacterales bacterium]|nr:mechanosensitive ion channel family protein [Caulobacterales bacterium]